MWNHTRSHSLTGVFQKRQMHESDAAVYKVPGSDLVHPPTYFS